MATNVTINTTYAGEYSAPYISAALLEANSISRGLISVEPNIKFKKTIRRMEATTSIKSSTCDFDAQGDVTVTERYLEPISLQVNKQFCKEDFRSTWDSAQMGYSAFDKMPSSFEQYLIGLELGNVAEAMEKMIYQGQGASADEFAGFLELWGADSDVIDVVADAGGVTAANVIAELGKIVDAIPQELYGKEDAVIAISNNIYRAYVRALGGFGQNGLGANGYNAQGNNQSFGDLVFDGVRLVVANGLPANTAFFARSSNLWFGTGLFNDTNIVKIKDMEDTDLSQNVRLAMRFTATVNYGIGSEIVLYKQA